MYICHPVKRTPSSTGPKYCSQCRKGQQWWTENSSSESWPLRDVIIESTNLWKLWVVHQNTESLWVPIWTGNMIYNYYFSSFLCCGWTQASGWLRRVGLSPFTQITVTQGQCTDKVTMTWMAHPLSLGSISTSGSIQGLVGSRTFKDIRLCLHVREPNWKLHAQAETSWMTSSMYW